MRESGIIRVKLPKEKPLDEVPQFRMANRCADYMCLKLATAL